MVILASSTVEIKASSISAVVIASFGSGGCSTERISCVALGRVKPKISKTLIVAVSRLSKTGSAWVLEGGSDMRGSIGGVVGVTTAGIGAGVGSLDGVGSIGGIDGVTTEGVGGLGNTSDMRGTGCVTFLGSCVIFSSTVYAEPDCFCSGFTNARNEGSIVGGVTDGMGDSTSAGAGLTITAGFGRVSSSATGGSVKEMTDWSGTSLELVGSDMGFDSLSAEAWRGL